MFDDEALNDLAVRTRQLEAHLVRSPEYVSRVGRKIKWLAVVLGLAVVLFIGEEIAYLDEPKPGSTLVLGSIDATLLVIVISAVLLARARGCRHRLNENWLNPDARKTLETLREEQTIRAATTPAANGTT
jgi:hypothetical protein